MSELLIGAGKNHEKRLHVEGSGKEWSDLITLDVNPDHNPNVVHDLEDIPLPFEPDSFDEIHAYEVLEHTGKQGDWRFFFRQFSDFWRILKPGGLLVGTSPGPGRWRWGDPGHTRVIAPESFVFLDQTEYMRQVGVTPMSDYRFVYDADFEVVGNMVIDDTFRFALRAIKPSRKGMN